MKLTFNTKGIIEIDYRVWLDNSENEVEKATRKVIERYSDSVVDKYLVQGTIINNKRDYLVGMLCCRPDNVEVTACNVECGMINGEFTLSGTYEFDITNGLRNDELPSHDALVDNIITLVYESIHTYGDFIDDSQLRSRLSDKFWSPVDVDFYYDYKSTHCEASLERQVNWMIFKGEIAMKLGFDIEIYNESYNDEIVQKKIDTVMDDAMGAYLDDYDIKLLVEGVLKGALETRNNIHDVKLTKQKVFNRGSELFLMFEAEFDYNGDKNVATMDVSDVFKEHVLERSYDTNSFYNEMYLYEPSESIDDFQVTVYVIEDSILSKAEIVGE